jgi:CheY-like chemotaxis protein/predicted Ser/Thr protein kinase
LKIDSFRTRFFELLPRYEYLGTLGHGGIGVVFKAFDRELEETVALKVLSPNLGQDENALLTRFKREVALNRRIKHPNVARMHDYGIAGDYPFISMELIDGTDLWTLVGQRRRFPPAEAVPILRQIARGTAAIHRLGILHRDLKSQNVIVDRQGAAVILDFGLARHAGETGLTIASVLLGTPQYMAPEQALGDELDARADLYSIGIIAWEMLTGRTPFEGESPVATAMKQVHEPLPDLGALVPSLPGDLVSVVTRVLSKERERRHASALELDDELGRCDTGPAAPPSEGRIHPDAENFLREVDLALDSILAPRDGRAAPREPRATPRGEAPKTLVAPRARRRPPIVVVAVEEVRDLLRLATSLCVAGCRTLEVRSGEEALETVLSRRVDLVVMETTGFPGMDGFDVARILKSIPRVAHVPVLLLAPSPDRARYAFALQSGAADLLPKPLPQALLEEKVWEVLSRRGFTRSPEGAPTPREKGSGVRPVSRSKEKPKSRS